jgi:Fe-S cluster assembly protein SufD
MTSLNLPPILVRDCLDRATFGHIFSSAHEPLWLLRDRETAWANYRQMAWPTLTDELWRRTNISHLNLEEYSFSMPGVLLPCSYRASPDCAGRAVFSGYTCHILELDPALAKDGVLWTTLGDALARFPDLVAQYFQETPPIYGKLDAMHKALWAHGMFLYVPKFLEIPQPFVVEFVETGDRHASFPHLLAVLEKGARCTLLHSIKNGDSREEVASNSATHLVLEEASALHYLALQQLNQKSFYYSHEFARLGRDAELSAFVATLGSVLSKDFLEVTLNEPGARVRLRGLYFAENDQHIDLRAVQYHKAGHTQSDVLYKGAVKDRARAVHQGLIQVSPNAQKIDAYESNKNLILSEAARVDSLPGLEINANDLKCTHGVTIGKVAEQEVFYLASRGLTRREAQKIIVIGFFEDILTGLPENLADECRNSVEQKVGTLQEDVH